MNGPGYPMVATHDPRLIEIAASLALLTGRGPDSFEYQMLYGIRPDEQLRLADPARGCGCTCPTAATGTATWCAGSPNGRPTWRSSCASLRTDR